MITQVIRGFFTCEKFPSLLYILVFFPDILRSCDRKFVLASEQVQGVAHPVSRASFISLCFTVKVLLAGWVSQKCRLYRAPVAQSVEHRAAMREEKVLPL